MYIEMCDATPKHAYPPYNILKFPNFYFLKTRITICQLQQEPNKPTNEM